MQCLLFTLGRQKKPESTDFIAQMPTTFDQTVALDGEVGEYATLARRKGDTWYAGALGNWDARELTLDCSFLGPGAYEAVILITTASTPTVTRPITGARWCGYRRRTSFASSWAVAVVGPPAHIRCGSQALGPRAGGAATGPGV